MEKGDPAGGGRSPGRREAGARSPLSAAGLAPALLPQQRPDPTCTHTRSALRLNRSQGEDSALSTDVPQASTTCACAIREKIISERILSLEN